MAMFGRILVASDLSPASEALVDCLGFLKGVGTEEVVLAHVIYVSLKYPYIGETEEAVAQLAAPRLEEQRRRLEAAGFRVTTAMPVGVPHVELDRLADEHKADLLVVGSRGWSMAEEVLLRGVANEVIRHARHPVLVVRMQIVEDEGWRRCEVACRDPFARVLYPTDFSDTAEWAFVYVERIVSAGCRAVELLHVEDRARLAERPTEVPAVDWARLRRMEERLRDLGVTAVSISEPSGSPTALILERARSGGDTLIVMGSQGRGFIQEVFLGSVSHIENEVIHCLARSRGGRR
jgi:nucleotide-binding universal stress UspA family protein